MWLIEQGEYSNLPPFSKLANLTTAFDTASWDSSRHFWLRCEDPCPVIRSTFEFCRTRLDFCFVVLFIDL
jgi:hypothetical protein